MSNEASDTQQLFKTAFDVKKTIKVLNTYDAGELADLLKNNKVLQDELKKLRIEKRDNQRGSRGVSKARKTKQNVDEDTFTNFYTFYKELSDRYLLCGC